MERHHEKNKLLGTTQKLIKQRFGAFFTSDILDEVLEGREPSAPMPWQSDWETLQQTMGESGKDDFIYPLVARFAHLDRLAWTARQLHDNGLPDDGMALLAPHIGHSLEGWRKLNRSLSLTVMLLVDVSLQTLAWLELRSWPKQSIARTEIPASQLLPWLEPGKKLIGHWLLRMLTAADCKNLGDFSVLMARKSIKLHNNYVSHDLLKKWSSGGQLMPATACECVLKAAGKKLNFDQERGRFAVVRFLSFLCDMVIADTRGEPTSWAIAQDQISQRYFELYKLEYSRLLAS